ncbi:hypothetical protein [Persephonella sp.]
MKKISVMLVFLLLFTTYSSGKTIGIYPSVRPYIEKGDKAVGPIKILELDENYISYYIYPKKQILPLEKAKIIGKTPLKEGMKVFIIHKKSGNYLIVPMEENYEENHEKDKDD